MKLPLQAKPQLRGPQGLRDWLAQLPSAGPTGPAQTAVALSDIPTELPAPAEDAAASVAAHPAPEAARPESLLPETCSLLADEYHCAKSETPDPSAARPWLRRVLGALVLLLSVSTGVSAGLAAPLAEPGFTALTQSPAATAVPYGASVLVTATFDAQVVGSRSVYLRYSTDNFATCQVLPMADASGNGHFDFTATIPNLTPTPARPVRVSYYAFTSSSKTAPTTCGSVEPTALALSRTNTFSYGVPFQSVSGPTVPTNCGNLITATLAAPPGAAEYFYLRFTTDLSGSFGAAGATTQTLAMTKAGATATATIPAQTPGSTITYYAFSSTAATAADAGDGTNPATTLQTGRNGAANYRFVTPDAVSISTLTAINTTCANGNNGEVTFTVGGGVPASYRFELAANGGAFQPATATRPAGEERYHLGGLLAGSRYQVRVSDGCGLAATAGPSAAIGSNNPAPTATLSNSGPVCAGGSTTVSFQLTGTAPWSLTYTDGAGNTIARTGVTANPFTFSTGVLPASRTYTLTQLSDANGCAAPALPLATTVTVNAKPTITVQLLTPAVCAGNNATLTGRLTGVGPWTVYYTIAGNPEPQTVGLGQAGQTSFDYRFNTAALTVGGPNAITVTSVSDASCLAFPNSSVTVSVTAGTTWTGNASSEWANAGNWTNCIPSQYLDARIPLLPSGRPYPSYTSGQTVAEVKNLTIDAGASLTYTAGTLALYGHLTNSGTLKLTQSSLLGTITGATVSLNGAADQTLSNLGEVYDLAVNTSNGATATLSGDVRVDHRLSASSGVLDTGAGTLTLAADQARATQGTATISESDASYVNGRVSTQRVLSTDNVGSTFGGLGLSLRPSGLVATGLTTVTRYTGPALAASILGRPSIQRWFRITSAVEAGLSLALTINYFNHELSTLTPASLTMFSTASSGLTPPTGPWTNYPNAAPTAPSAGYSGAVTVSGLTHLSDWTLGEPLSPLPVVLTRFEARRAGPDAELSWTTASERNSRGFEVQVSADGQQFRALHLVPSATGDSHAPRTYAYLDREAGKAGPRYYRLRQLDHDGTAGFSPVRVLHFEGSAAALPASLSAVPNPFSSREPLTLWVQSPLAAEAPLTITDVAGRLVRRQVLRLPAGASRVALPDLAGLPAGVYLVQLPLDGQPRHLRVVKE